MGRINYYESDDVEKRLRSEAETKGMSLTDLIKAITAAYVEIEGNGDTKAPAGTTSPEGTTTAEDILTGLDIEIKRAKLQQIKRQIDLTLIKTAKILISLPAPVQIDITRRLNENLNTYLLADRDRDDRPSVSWCQNEDKAIYDWPQYDACKEAGHTLPWVASRPAKTDDNPYTS